MFGQPANRVLAVPSTSTFPLLMPDPIHVLLAEDDLNLGNVLAEYMATQGFEVALYRDGLAAWAGYERKRPELCILDVMMPKEDGFSLARRIREVDTQTPIIFLTAKGLPEDRIEGFTIGGDDYLTKPFTMRELLLRIQAIMRRLHHAPASTNGTSTVAIGRLSLLPAKRKLKKGASEVDLTHKETQLLHLLAQHANRTLTRTEALKKIWGDDNYHNARSMDVYIAKLRKHLKGEAGVEIMTVHGEGFQLLVEG